jgi:hypothetical protein
VKVTASAEIVLDRGYLGLPAIAVLSVARTAIRAKACRRCNGGRCPKQACTFDLARDASRVRPP